MASTLAHQRLVVFQRAETQRIGEEWTRHSGLLAQPLSKQTSQRLTRLHILSPASESHLPLILSYVPPCRPLRPSLVTYSAVRQAHGNHHHLSCPVSA